MNSETPSVSAVVLAGGHGHRMGQDKALLRLGGQSLLARTVHTLAPLSDDLVVVTDDAARYRALGLPVRLVADEQPGVGALMGLYSGLKAARHAWALVVACDMPFLNPSLLRYMIALSPGYEAIVPRIDDLYEPIHAIYARTCLPVMEDLIATGRRRIFDLFSRVRVRYVDRNEIEQFDPEHLSFLNVNTPEDWLRVQARFEASARS